MGISSESADELQTKFVVAHSAKYWIGSDPQNKTMGGFAGDGSVGIPQFYLIDARGKVVGMEVPSEKVIEKLLEQIFVVDLKRTLHQKLAKVQLAYERGAYAIAWKTAGQCLADKDEAVVADANFVRKKVLGLAQHKWKILKAEAADAKPGRLYGSLLVMKHSLSAVDPELRAWVDQQIKLVAKKPEIKAKDERRAWGKFEKTLKRELKGFASDYERKRVKALYEKVPTDLPRTEAAQFCKKRLEKL